MVNFNPPLPPPGHLSIYLTSLVEALRRVLLPLVSKDEAVSRIILLSPNGTAYDLRVKDDGTLETVRNDGKSG
jgi:hypothetical protein